MRDSATRNDYADQRYYTSILGRFMTPDPSLTANAVLKMCYWRCDSGLFGAKRVEQYKRFRRLELPGETPCVVSL